MIKMIKYEELDECSTQGNKFTKVYVTQENAPIIKMFCDSVNCSENCYKEALTIKLIDIDVDNLKKIEQDYIFNIKFNKLIGEYYDSKNSS